MSEKLFEVWTLDVWGNKEDGYTVNDRSKIGTVELSDEADKEEILQALFDEGIIVDPGIVDTTGVEIIDSYPNWEIEDYGRPLFELTSEE